VSAPTATRTLQVLRLLAAAPGPLPASQLATRLGIPRASAYRLLEAMEAEGFVARFPDEGRWGLGVATFEVGSAYLRRQPLERLARPLLARLVAQTRHTAHLGILLGPELLYLLVERPRRPDPLVTAVGVRLPAHRTASGRAILAHLPAEQVRAAFSRGGLPRELDDLRQDRRRGWSVEEGLVTPGYGSVAAAVLDPSGRPAAAISVTAREGLDDLVPAVRAAAATLSQRLSRLA
jgi:DNA-binding IclR family transcriptional regulator